MDKKLRKIIQEYEQIIQLIWSTLLNEYNISTSSELLDFRRKTPYGIFKYNNEIYKYLFHGKGIRVYNDTVEFNWDFGYRGKLLGLHPFEVSKFASTKSDELGILYDYKTLSELFEKYVKEKKMIKNDGQYYLV